MSVILYQDNQVTIYKELIFIRKYYFPLGTSKTILISDIEAIGLHSSEGVTHSWGVCTKHLNNWFPYDANRKNKTKFIEFQLKGKKIKSAITPDDPEKAFKILWENFTKEGQEYSQRCSNMGNEQPAEDYHEERVQEAEQTTHKLTVEVQKKEEQLKVENIE